MSITYNQPSKDRESVVAPTVEEMSSFVAHLNFWLSDMPDAMNMMQRILHDYENKCYFHTVVGGWEGLALIKNSAYLTGAKDSTDTSIRECEGMPFINSKDETE